MVDPWRQPFPQIKPFHNGMAATSSFFAKQALSVPDFKHDRNVSTGYGILGADCCHVFKIIFTYFSLLDCIKVKIMSVR